MSSSSEQAQARALAILAEAGLAPHDEHIVDGKYHRLYSADGADVGKGCAILLTEHPVLLVNDFRGECKSHKLHAWTPKSKEELAESRREMERQQILAEEARRAKFDDVQREALSYVGSLKPATEDNPYIKRKGIDPHRSLLADGDKLVVRMQTVHTAVRNCQIIHADGSKRFLTGGEVTGCYFEFPQWDGGDPRTLVCEGVATGRSLNQAIGARTIVCFNAGNVKAVVLALQKAGRLEGSNTDFVPDNDVKTGATYGKNPGLAVMEEAALAVGGHVLPVVPDDLPMKGNPKGATDANDVHQVLGLDKLRELLLAGTDYMPEAPDGEARPRPIAAEPPENIFPARMEDVITDVATVFSMGHRAFAFAATLALLGHGVNGYLAVESKKDKCIGGNAFILLIAPTSSSKTDTFNTLFREFDSEDSKIILENRAEDERLAAEIEKWEALPAGERKKKPRPARRRGRISDMYDDMTDAALFDALDENMRHDGVSCVTLRGDEALHVLTKLDAYKQNGIGGSLDDVIKMWNGGKIKRKRSTTRTVNIPKAYLNLSANTQPYAFTKMFNGESMLSGLLGRFIIIRADIWEDLEWTEAEISEESKETIKILSDYLKKIRKITPPGSPIDLDAPTQTIIKVSADAKKRFADWYKSTAKSFRLDGENRKALVNKVSMNLSKIALHIHVARCCFGEERDFTHISLETLERAIKAMDFIVECERYLWDVLDGKRFTERVDPAAVRMAEIILARRDEIDGRTRKVLNKTFREWAIAGGLADDIDQYQLRGLLKALDLKPSGGHAGGRGRLVTEADVDRLISLVASSGYESGQARK